MTHAFIVDKRAKSTTSGMELQVPVTVVEVPPMKIAAVRFYESSIVGLKTAGEVWAKDLDSLLDRRLNVPKNHDEASFARYDGLDIIVSDQTHRAMLLQPTSASYANAS